MVNPLLVPGNRPGGILPRYRPLGTMKAGTLRKVIAAALADWRDDDDPLPEAVRRRHAFPAMADALRAIHQPARARRRIDRDDEGALHLRRAPVLPARAAMRPRRLSRPPPPAPLPLQRRAAPLHRPPPAFPAQRRAGGGLQRHRQRPALAAHHAAPAAGRGRQRQDHRGLPGAAAGQGERPARGLPGPDRDPGPPALPERLRLFRPRGAGVAHRRLRPRRTTPRPGGARRRRGLPGLRHPRPDRRERRLQGPGHGRHRRAAPLRGGAAGRPVLQEPGRRPAGHHGHPHSAHHAARLSTATWPSPS